MNDPTSTWQIALADLELKMTRATYDNLLRDSHALAWQDNTTLTVVVRNDYALDWLDTRLRATIDKTTQPLGYTVQFVVGDAPSPAPTSETTSTRNEEIYIQLVEFDPLKRGYVQCSRYATTFWINVLGRGPFLTWLELKAAAWNVSQGGDWPTIPDLCDVLGCNRKTLTGRTARGKRIPGWLETLEGENIIRMEQRPNNAYRFTMLESLPLLTPQQVKRLPPALQDRHERWLNYSQIELETWEQMELPTLAGLRESPPHGGG